jgi:hypothetical protein
VNALYWFVLFEWAIIILWGVTNRWPLRGYLAPMLFWAFFGPVFFGFPLLLIWEFGGGLITLTARNFDKEPVGTVLTFALPILFVYALISEHNHQQKP